MIYHRQASLNDHALLSCHGKPLITAGFVTVCCSMSAVSKTSCSHIFAQGSYYTTHAWTQCSHDMAEYLALMSMVVIMHGPYLKQT